MTRDDTRGIHRDSCEAGENNTCVGVVFPRPLPPGSRPYTPGDRGPNVVNGDGDRTGYSVVLFGPNGRRYRHPDAALLDELIVRPGISSIQITFHDDKPAKAHAMPPGGFRLAIVNGFDLRAAMAGRDRLREYFLPPSRSGGG